jgi:NAD(P)-dependent dehydrogenase (short-subunit alcohol dehydrogenase family)
MATPAPIRARLDGRVAVVTGGAGGLGLAITQELGDWGASVAVCDVDDVALAAMSDADRLLAHHADVRDADAVAAFLDRVDGAFGRVDVLVNVPGGTFVAPFTETRRNGWNALVDLNFTQVLEVTHQVIPRMRASGGGSIVNVTSSEAHRGAPEIAVYAAMKAAVAQFSRCLALEVSADGIRVNCVAPDQFPTPNGVRVGAFPADLDAPDLRVSNAVTVPLGRMGRPEEVAACVAFLASDLAAYVTGTDVLVDGGVIAAAGWSRWPGGWSNRLPANVAGGLDGDSRVL